MTVTWRFRVVRFDDTCSFIRRPASVDPFIGSVNEAMAFANRGALRRGGNRAVVNQTEVSRTPGRVCLSVGIITKPPNAGVFAG